MKRLFCLLCFLFAVASVQAQVQVPEQDTIPKPEGPHFDFTETEYDFGKVARSSREIEHCFEFTNDGTEPVVITKTLTSCSCVKTEYGKKPIPPGGKGEIKVTYEVNKKESGVFYKVIEVYSNSADKRNNLIVKGNAVE